MGAEYVLKIVERGTHDWDKFVTPEELKQLVYRCNSNPLLENRNENDNNVSTQLVVEDVAGIIYNPFNHKCYLDMVDKDVNYIVCISKKKM